MAIFKDKNEKEEIRKSFKVFLAQNDVKLKHLCINNGLDYNTEYNKIFIGNVNETDVNKLVHLIDKRANLRNIAGRFIINKAL
jgi:hypothetical protein